MKLGVVLTFVFGVSSLGQRGQRNLKGLSCFWGEEWPRGMGG
ncbi:uncharacterized protein G2W53_043548 [Senna tora]|uniref:Uncharacterized protein n=1 Tax=Senna tora TaxID=362788 RepID=A0A834SP47_9FABA|nr:uncharacterized protein G2W53_043548 [Senna tora]